MENKEKFSKFYRGNLIEKVDATKTSVRVMPIGADTINRINKRILFSINNPIIYSDETQTKIYKTLTKKFK